MNTQIASIFVAGMVLSLMSSAHAQEGVGGVGLSIQRDQHGNALVAAVAPGGPTERVGIRQGDYLVAVDRRAVTELTGIALADALRGVVGSQVTLAIVRGQARAVEVTVRRADLSAMGRGGEAPRNEIPRIEIPRNDLPRRAAGGAIKLTMQQIVDPQAENRVAATYLLPHGWKTQGQVTWMHTLSVLTNLQLTMFNPENGLTISWLPTQHFSWTQGMADLTKPGANVMGCIQAAPIGDPAQFVEAFYATEALRHLRGQRPVGGASYPKLAAMLIAGNQGWQAQSVRLRYAFDHQGKAYEQDVYFTLAYAPANAMGMTMWNVQNAYTVAAPKGLLNANEALIKALIGNAQFNCEWLAYREVVQQLRRQGLAAGIEADRQFGQRLAQYHAHIQQLGQKMHEERMKSFDRIAESQREYLGGIETYNDPYLHRPVHVPAGYKKYWTNHKGEIILSDLEAYDPNVGDTVEWKAMERRDPMMMNR